MCPLTWHVDTGPQSTHIAVHGTPDTSSVLALHAVLERHLARRADFVFIDLSDLPPAGRAAMTGSPPPAQHGTVASGTEMLLCGTSSIEAYPHPDRPGRQSALVRLFLRAREALTVGVLRSPSLVEQVLPVSGSARHSRDIVTYACVAWDLTRVTGAATVLASELVSRTIQQTSTIMTVVALLERDILYLCVRAGSAPALEPPDERTAALQAVVIDTLADHWGHLSDDHETVTWAALPTRTGAR